MWPLVPYNKETEATEIWFSLPHYGDSRANFLNPTRPKIRGVNLLRHENLKPKSKFENKRGKSNANCYLILK